MKKNYFLLALFILISVSFNVMLAADNYILHSYSNVDSDVKLLVNAGTNTDAQIAQKAIFHNDVSAPWPFRNYATATQNFVIYTDANAACGGGQWSPVSGLCPIVFNGQSFMNNSSFPPIIFFIAPAAVIYNVTANSQYHSNRWKATAGSSLFYFKAKDGTSVVNMNFRKNYTDQTVLAPNFSVNLQVT